jgi:hypothetical protein
MYELFPQELRLDSFECALIEGFLLNAKSKSLKAEIDLIIDAHEKVLISENRSSLEKKYSKDVIHIANNAVSHGAGVHLDSIVNRIELIERFDINQEIGEDKESV